MSETSTACGEATAKTTNKARMAAPGCLRKLGLVGLEPIEPIVFAALATESPLLLIGPHGTAKSLLLLRLCEALGLAWRHYNASLLNYDDLVGYPLPDADGSLRFVETPASIWGAQVVFLDEISRCRPDMQNRLFSIVHEKRVQGLALNRLVHRWAAMNPPPAEEPEDGACEYLGSEPLDPALADRFPFVVEMPRWEEFSAEDQEELIRTLDLPVSAEDAANVRATLERVRSELEPLRQAYAAPIADYVRTVAAMLRSAGISLSARRAVMLHRNVTAVHAACVSATPGADLGESAWLALRHSLPQRAEGRRVQEMKLYLAHKEAWAAIRLEKLDPRRVLLAETDPVRRALKAAAMPALGPEEFSAYVADGLAEAPLGARHALAFHLLRSGVAGRLNVAVAEQVAELYALLVAAQDINEVVSARAARDRIWAEILEVVCELPPKDEETALLSNLLAGLFAGGALAQPKDVEKVLDEWRRIRALCRGGQ